jgi:hypothetical protein
VIHEFIYIASTVLKKGRIEVSSWIFFSELRDAKVLSKEERTMPEALVKIDFAGAAKAIESVVNLIKLFSQNIRDSIKAGLESVDILTARRASSRLKSMHLRVSNLVVQQGVILLPTAEKYLRMPTPANWDKVRKQIQETLNLVEPLSKDFLGEKSNFVLEESYNSLLAAMKKREVVLKQVLEIETPPSTEEDLADFRSFIENYVVLVRELQQLDLSLTTFLKAK